MAKDSQALLLGEGGTRDADPLSEHSFLGLADQVIDHRLQVAGLPEHPQLTIGTGAVVQYPVRVLDLLARPELVEHVAEEPVDTIPKQFITFIIYINLT